MVAYTVTTLEDEADSGATVATPGGNGLSLREALAIADAAGGFNTITFAQNLAGGVIELDYWNLSSLRSYGNNTIDGDLDNDGAPDITLDPSGGGQILFVGMNAQSGMSTAATTIDGLILRESNAQAMQSYGDVTVKNSAFTGNWAGFGAAIYQSQGSLSISNSTFANNSAVSSGVTLGGTIQTYFCDVTIASSTFENNDSDAETGLIYAEGGTLTVTGSTFAENLGGVLSADTASISNSTFFENKGLLLNLGSGAINDVTAVQNTTTGDLINIGNATIANSILVGNSAATDYFSSTSSISTSGKNIFDVGATASSANITLTSDVASIFVTDGNGDAILANNGGTVKTVALNPVSTNPALDAGGLSTDARGESAFDIPGLGSAAGDLGAYEYVGASAASVDASSADGQYWLGQTIDITVKFSRAVSVTGVPTLLLETGSTDRTATYVSGSSTDTLTFRYAVQAGDTASDLNFLSTAALALNGGTISDVNTFGAVTTLPATGSAQSLASQSAIQVSGVTAPASPVLAAALADQAATEDTAFNCVLSATAFTDANGDALTYAASLPNGGALPSWLSFNPSTRTFSGTPLNGDVGALTVKVTASDGSSTASDEFTLTVANVNDAPTAIGLSASSVIENAAAGTVVGSLTAVDADKNDTAAFTLIDNAGGRFTLSGDTLLVAKGAELDFETATSYAVTIRATDAAGSSIDKVLAIDITDVIGDDVIGTKGNNTLKGGDSNDILDGRGGNDRLTGGDGADTFMFGRGYGRDTITDFDPSEGDIIDLSGAVGIKSFRDLIKHHVEDTGKDLIITADDGSVLILKGVDVDDLSKDCFVF